LRKPFLAKSAFNRLRLAKLLMRSDIGPGLADVLQANVRQANVREVNAPSRTPQLRSIMIRLPIIGQHYCARAIS
jgi:hypothetical protein